MATLKQKEAMLRLMKRVPEDTIAQYYWDGYFPNSNLEGDGYFYNLAALMDLVEECFWTWNEFKSIPKLQCYLNVKPYWSITRKEWNDVKTKLANSKPCVVTRGAYYSELLSNPTKRAISKCISEYLIATADPDHCFVESLYVTDEVYARDDGSEFEYMSIQFSLGS